MGITDPIPGTSTVSVNTNLFWDNNEDGFTGTNPIDGTPQFVDPNAGNYHIGIDSAAIDSGVESSVTSDIDEDPRSDGSPDIGADEFFPVNPKEGTVGTEITLRNFRFGTKKGTVMIGSAALKTLEWKDGVIRCRLARALSPGTYDITINPKPYDTATPITLASAITIKEPEIATVTPGNAPPKTEVTITGNFFGTKVLPPPSRTTLPTVYLEYDKGGITKKKYCTVITWAMNPTTGESTITFRVPKGLSTGPHPLKMTNKVGTAETSFTID